MSGVFVGSQSMDDERSSEGLTPGNAASTHRSEEQKASAAAHSLWCWALLVVEVYAETTALSALMKGRVRCNHLSGRSA
jgi:hypothetical protein